MKLCFDCGRELKPIGSGPGWMNSDQWDAVRAGDYFGETCQAAGHPNGNCYFWDTPTVTALKRVERKPALNTAKSRD